MPPVLEVRSVSKSYGATRVLRDVSFVVRKGEMLTVTGRSGSGKSTLFKLLAGLDTLDKGEILVEDLDISQLDDAAISEMRLRKLGLIFQSFNLLPDLTALENVRLPLDIAGVLRRDAKERALEMLALVGVEAHAAKRPHQLSGGEQQRCAIARALVNDPAVLLADEPTGNLDRANAENVLRAFDDINERLGATILIITHDPLAIERIPVGLDLVEGEALWRGTTHVVT